MSDKLTKGKKTMFVLGGLAAAGAIAGALFYFLSQDNVSPEDLYDDEKMKKALKKLKKEMFPITATLAERSLKFMMMIKQQMAMQSGMNPQSIQLGDEHFQFIEQAAKGID